MNKTVIIIFLSLLFHSSFAQRDTSFRLLKTIPLLSADFAVDKLENLYVLTAGDQLKKFGPAGDSLAAYNNVRRFGKLHSFDVSNPLKTLLFYKDFSTIVLLDRQLSLRSTVDLRRQNIIQVSAASLAYDNNIWIFDALENKLKKVDESGAVLLETADFRTLFNEAFVPEKIIDHDNSLYLFAQGFGVLQFDYFGSFQKKYLLPKWQNISLLNKHITGVTESNIAIFNTTNLMMEHYQFPSSFGSFNQYLIGNNKLFARTKDSVSIYSFRFY